jgi:hypothetical protein
LAALALIGGHDLEKSIYFLIAVAAGAAFCAFARPG